MRSFVLVVFLLLTTYFTPLLLTLKKQMFSLLYLAAAHVLIQHANKCDIYTLHPDSY